MYNKVTYLKDIARKYDKEGRYIESDLVLNLLRRIAQTATPAVAATPPVAATTQPTVTSPATPVTSPAETQLSGCLTNIIKFSEQLMRLNSQKYSGLSNLIQGVYNLITLLSNPNQNYLNSNQLTQTLPNGQGYITGKASDKFVKLSQSPNANETYYTNALMSIMQAAQTAYRSLSPELQQRLSTLPSLLNRQLSDYASMPGQTMVDSQGNIVNNYTESGFDTRTEKQGYTINKTPDGHKNTKHENNINKLIEQWVQTGEDDPQGRGQNYAHELVDRYIKVYLLPWIKQQPKGTVTLQAAQQQLSQILGQHQQSQKFIGMANQWLGQYFPGQQAGATGQANNGQQNQNSELNNLYIFRGGNPKHNGIPVSQLFGTNGQPDPYSGQGFLLPLAQFGNTTSPTDSLYDARGVKQPFNWDGSQIIQSRQYGNGDLASPIPTQTGF